MKDERFLQVRIVKSYCATVAYKLAIVRLFLVFAGNFTVFGKFFRNGAFFREQLRENPQTMGPGTKGQIEKKKKDR